MLGAQMFHPQVSGERVPPAVVFLTRVTPERAVATRIGVVALGFLRLARRSLWDATLFNKYFICILPTSYSGIV